MDNHPIPQDVTGFQFKLIGQMTVKQFAYLCAGIILGWIFFSSHLFILIRLPISLFFFLSGFLLAFVPLEGRPMDTMISNFVKALFSPNQYVYDKSGSLSFGQSLNLKHLKNSTEPAQSVHVLQNVPPAPSPALDLQTAGNVVPSIQIEVKETPQLMPNTPVGSSDEQKLKQELEDEKHELAKELEEAETLKSGQNKNAISPSDMHDKLAELEKKLEETMSHKQMLEQELITLSQKQKMQKPKAHLPQPSVQTSKPATKSVGKSGFAFLPDSPNVIIGVLRDPRGNVLPNMLVEVQDNEGNPVRAFKTNQLGQFASATALRNGIYTVAFEDPTGKNTFDKVEVEAKGEILDPIVVVSHDQREELRKALFETKN